ncbi:anthranilate synthase component I [Halonotius terrestris]|uniref:Anthranilate synthase component 1 n=1 Tax=Halonotius terrestris TaxID=2487750 RepID=A0A8J8TDK1_9EURY|nr:anthranilate synthase component I [Halonotius terrestris]TQQ83606.1 anthranilate synthase component I [Halonotius terrestris]
MTTGETAASGDDAAAAADADSDLFSFDRSRDDYVALVDADRDEPVVARAAATLDLDTSPLAAYAALADRSEYNFLLESAEKVASSDPDGAFTAATDAERHARYSFVGYDPEAIISVYPNHTEVDRLGDVGDLVVDAYRGDAATDGDVLDRLRRGLPAVDRRGFPDVDRRTLSGGLVGFLAHEAVYDLVLEEVGRERPDTDLPDAQFALTTRTLVFDDAEGTVELVFTPVIGPDDDPSECYDDLVAEAADVAATLAAADDPPTTGFSRTDETAGSQSDYEDAVRTAKQHVLDGDIYQGVISRRRQLAGDIDPISFYESLRSVNPSPYMYLMSHGDFSIVGASPETLVSVEGDRIVSNPIAGTCPRGSSPVEDRRLAGEMLADGKERAEHTMLVDLARNDVRRVADPGSVEVEEFMSVLKYSHVQHIESTVTARVADEYDAFDAARVTFPAGTLTGAPKVRAMEIIDDLEASPRGVYGGGVGYFSWSGDADFAIVIRTATIEHEGADGDNVDGDLSDANEGDDLITVQAGAGLVADSDPTSEYEETEQKMDGVLTAIEGLESQEDEQ